MNHVVLVEPDIPQNTGNIARSCALTETTLHLIRPLGFSLTNKQFKRAGLDYWPHLNLKTHRSFKAFLEDYGHLPIYILTTKAKKNLWEADFEDEVVLVFGSETKGLDPWFHQSYGDRALRIYMKEDEHLRSMNLSNAVNVCLYEALRQQQLR